MVSEKPTGESFGLSLVTNERLEAQNPMTRPVSVMWREIWAPSLSPALVTKLGTGMLIGRILIHLLCAMSPG